MSFKIGFMTENAPTAEAAAPAAPAAPEATPVKSVVQVRFPARGLTCAYYNDAFDLHKGDLVYVEGKLEGMRGIVVDVAYTFKIKLSDYKRVIRKVDTNVTGELYLAGSHFVTFDPTVLTFEQVITWFQAPEDPEEEYASGGGNETFLLEHLSDMKVSPDVAERGRDYYMQNKVVYLSVNGTQGRAIVEGTQPYTVEFTYCNGEIGDLVCNCFCSCTCKHDFAAMLQLRETLEIIQQNYSAEYRQSGCFAAVSKGVFFSLVVDRKETGRFVWG